MTDRIICYGDVIDDIVVAPQGPIQSDTDTPSVIRARPGGSAANTAAWLAAAGTAVDFVGVVGRGDAQRHAEALPGVETVLREHPDLQTGRIVIVVQQDRRDMLTDRGANVALVPDDVSCERLGSACLLHLTGHVLQNDAGFDGVCQLIDRCRTAGVLVSFSPGSASFVPDLRAREIVDRADLVFAGLEEARTLTGLDSPDAMASALASNARIAVVTRGRAGATVNDGKSVFSLAVQPKESVDPTGAGDAFCAGFLASWLREHDAERAVRAGAVLAGEAVGIVGGRPSNRTGPIEIGDYSG